MGGDVEDARQLCDLGGDGDRQEEHRDGEHLRDERVEDLWHVDQDDGSDSGSGKGPKSWLQVQPAQSTSSVRRSSRADCTAA